MHAVGFVSLALLLCGRLCAEELPATTTVVALPNTISAPLSNGVARTSPVLLSMDFDATNPLPALAASSTQEPMATGVDARADWVADVGTIREEGTCVRTGALRLQVDASDTAKAWSGALTTGGLAVQNGETNLAKLTLAFDLRVSSARPVVVRMESFDAEKRRTGGLERVIHPAAPNDYQRFTFELSDMKPSGDGAFDPTAPQVSLTFEVNSSVAGIGWPACAGHELRVDNLYYAAPALYVSPSGSDKKNDGHSEDKPLATIGKALERAQPGDIILLMEGVFTKKWALAWFVRAGSPAAWITLKNYPGQHPVLKSIDSNIVRIGQGGNGKISAAPALAYLEVRGLSIRGVADEVAEKYKADIGKSIGTVNGNGLTVDGRYDTHKPHHIRIADNELTQCSGGGISVIHADRVQIENNHAYENCHWTVFASSGISVYQAFNFDAETGGHRFLIRHNRVHHNYCTQPWVVTGKPSDGNGIIVDDMRNHQNKSTNGIYRGGILVQGNISYENGGSGMHSYASDHVDFVNNTVANNSTVMDYGQLSVTECGHVRVLNNILASPTNRPMNRVNGKFSDVLLSHNLFWGGNGDTVPGEHPIVADPLFRDAAKGDFHLGANSPARNSAGIWEIVPTVDLTGHIRIPDGTLDRGALEAGKLGMSAGDYAQGVKASQPRATAQPAAPISSAVVAVPPATSTASFPLLGKIKARSAKEILSSSWSIGGETLDRDFGVYANYRKYLGPLGAKALRLQCGWAKCETRPGVYDFAWLDDVVNDAIAQGVQPWLEVSYGNKLYPDGGGTGLGGALPKSTEALAAWDNWVRAIVRRYRDRVAEWEIWNEPDLGPSPAEEYAEFFIRTAEVIRSEQPKARLYALALAHKVPYAESFLARVHQCGKLPLIDAITVHSYPNNPDDTRNVDELRALIAKHGGAPIAVRQGETGATSKYQENFALKKLPMTEIIQAKWNLRRMLAHHGKDVPVNLFTMIDLHYRWGGKLDMNYKGLLASNPDQTVAYAKPAYAAAQNVFAVFDDSLSRMADFPFTVQATDKLALYAFQQKATGKQAVTLWLSGSMPSDSNAATPLDITLARGAFTEPVYADLLTGKVYALPGANWSRVGEGIVLRQIPVYDSPILIAEKGVLTLETTTAP